MHRKVQADLFLVGGLWLVLVPALCRPVLVGLPGQRKRDLGCKASHGPQNIKIEAVWAVVTSIN